MQPKADLMFRTTAKKIIYAWPNLFWASMAKSQNANQESVALKRISTEIKANPSFVEFGFHPFEYNSVSLTKMGFEGLLIDGSQINCDVANKIFSKLGLKTSATNHWIATDSLQPIYDFVSGLDGNLGVLSIVVDGNDYWLLRELLLHVSPDILCVEYNPSFERQNISTPYKRNYSRHAEHPSGWYHGASITAFCGLVSPNYLLVENVGGVNLVFVRAEKMTKNLRAVSPKNAYKEGKLRNRWSGTSAKEQWEAIKHLNYVEFD